MSASRPGIWRKPLLSSEEDGCPQDLADPSPSPIALSDVNSWDPMWQRLLFRILVPVSTLVEYQIDPVSLTDMYGRPAVRMVPGAAGRTIRLELYHLCGEGDALMELELGDTPFNQIEVLWVAMQDPCGPRYDIDVTADGQATMRGILRRNLEAEQAALRAGLAPGQTRRGLRAFVHLAGRMETLMACLNQREYVAQPLFYHTAVLFERIGCAYLMGQARMEEIDAGFEPGGELRQRLDGSSPFRMPELAESIRGRSWAIHGGILEQPWDRMRMAKRLGHHAGVNTCPGIPY